ncbi:MAG: AsnC family transcriptional regulator, partial [Alphaproteobacteria bacterium]
MDDIDRNILLELQGNGAAGLAELAKVAGLSVSATAERVKRLEERGTIRGWRADLEPAAVGCPQLAWVFVMLQSGAEAGFIAAMAEDEAVLECHAISGRWSYQVKLRLPDLAAVDSFTNARLRAYGAGLFPMAEGRGSTKLHWLDPALRGILPLDHGFHLPRRLRRTVLS